MINYNVDPYYDDFNPNDNYHRILFRPGRAVQARELTQSQTILQNQISQFASAIYSQNTPISGGQVTTNLFCGYIKLLTTYGGSSITAANFLNKTITDSTGSINARVIATAEATGTAITPGDPPTLIVTYLSGTQFSDNMDVYVKTFAGGQTSSIPSATTIGIVGGTTSVGSSSVASIGAGVFYVVSGYNQALNADGATSQYSIGNFVNVLPQTVILDKYDNTPTLRVGLNIVESTVTSSEDIDLLDPAAGASNYQAPGADRYQITLSLQTRPVSLGNDDGFIELLKLSGGEILKQSDDTIYSKIDDYFAKRTYDTNGDFIVNPFTITPTSNTINSANYDLNIGPGVAYVRGYRIDNQSSIKLTNPRARTYITQNNNPVFIDYGNFLYVDSLKGVFDVTTLPAVDFHSVPYTNINANTANTYASTRVGTGYIRGLVYDRSTADANTNSYVYRAYVTDFVANTLTANANSATSTTISVWDRTASFSNVANAYTGVTLSIDTGTSSGDTRIITQYSSNSTSNVKTFTVNKSFSIVPDATSNISLKFSSTNISSIANGIGLTAKTNVNAASKTSYQTGGVTITNSVIQNPGLPELLFKIGNPFLANLNNSLYSTTQVFRGKSFNGSGAMTVSLTGDLPGSVGIVTFGGASGGALSTSAIQQNYTVICTANGAGSSVAVGDVIPFGVTIGANTRTVTGTTTSITFNATDTANINGSMVVTVIAKMNIVNGDSNKVVKAKNLVTGNTTVVSTAGPDGIVNTYTYVDLNNGQVYIPYAGLVSPGSLQLLYVNDVKRIVKIIDTGSSSTSPTVPMLTNLSYDITNNYYLDNGQRDNTYEHARLKLKPGVPQPRGNILVIFDYYRHVGYSGSTSGDGYFSGMSYLSTAIGGQSLSPEAYGSIPSYTAKDGIIYNLRDCLDFRPCRKNGTASMLYEGTGTPSSDNTGVYVPQDLTNFSSNYAYYLARNDLLVLSKDKSFKIISGVPSTTPSLPSPPDGALTISNLFNQPYTASIPSETPQGSLPNLSIESVKHQRYTMQDISTLNTRINNLEYYASLSALEQNAQTLQIPDSNGLNRFKNGILVDDFSTFGVVDTNNLDFNASVDTINRKMTASQTVTNYPLQSSVVYNSLGSISSTTLSSLNFGLNKINQLTNIFSLPYTSTALVTQQLASNTVNLNPFTTPIYSGAMTINPPMDNWVDNTKAPDLLLVDPNLQVYIQSNTINTLSVGNWQVIPGTQWSTSTSWTTGRTRVNQTDSFATLGQTTINGYWSKLPSTYNNTNGFITNISIQPYIRGQDLTALAGSLKTNTPLTATFDNVVVDQHISLPTVIELTSNSMISGTFSAGDTIGYLSSGNWNFLGRVIDVYSYPTTHYTRLYVFVSAAAMIAAGTLTTIQNGFFDSNGNYLSSTASGTPQTGTGIINGVVLNMSGGVIAANNGTSSNIAGGGTYSTGVTQITLSPLASNTNNFYTGSQISITATNGSAATIGTATVVSYVGATKLATLDTAVNISNGFNSNFGALLTSTYRIRGNKNWSNNTSYLVGMSNSKAPQISSNESGNFAGVFTVPVGIFQTGQRTFRVDNRTVSTDSTSATTYASANFTASGLATTSQALDFAPSIDSATNTFASTQFQANQLIATTFSYTPYDPVAQTFIIDKVNYPNGVFLSSVKFFFQSKPTTTNDAVTLSIVGTLNGYPNGKVLDNSIVTLTPDKINTSSSPHYLDSATYTEFVFPAPVFIQPNKLYSFLLQSPSTEYNVYLAAQGATAIPSSVKNLATDPTPSVLTKIGTTPYIGSIFESQNAITWVAEPTKSLMFVLNQALFDITQNPKIQFTVPKGLPTRKSSLNDVNRGYLANTVVNLDNSLSAANVLVDAFNVTTTDLIPTSTNIDYTYNATLSSTGGYSGETGLLPGRFGSPTINNLYLNDGYGERVLVTDSSSSFLTYASLSSTDPNVSPFVSDDGLAVYAVKYNINNLPLSNSQITLVSGGTGYNGNVSSILSVSVSAPDIPGGTQATAAANVVSGNIQSIYVTTGGSGYLAPPTITINDSTTRGGNSNASVALVSEYSATGGNAATKYITKKVVLASGNDSGDLRVYLTAYRPINTNIYVMYKILSSSDTQPFEAGTWQLMTPVVSQTYYSPSFGSTAEFQFAPGINNTANNSVSYVSTNGNTYKSFIQFAVKVILTTSDNTNVPYLTDIRAIAVPSGTGI